MNSADPLPEYQRFSEFWRFSDPAATEIKFRELVAEASRHDDEDCRLQILTQIARAQGLQQKFDEAHTTLDEVQRRMDAAAPIVRIRYLLERGRVHNSNNQPGMARPLFVDAWETAQAAGEDNLAVDAAHMVAIVEQGAAALAWNKKAMEYAEQSDQPSARRWLGSLYNNIGWTFHELKQYVEALEVFEKGLAWREEQQQPDETRIARWCVARTCRSLGRVEEALQLQEQILKQTEAAGKTDGFVFEELAECHLALGHDNSARAFFRLAHEELSKDAWLTRDEPERLARLAQLADGKA